MCAIESLPAEIIKHVGDLLEYGDRLSLKHTSRALYHLVDVPTIRSFRIEMKLRNPARARSLKTLTEENHIRRDQVICQYCSELLNEWDFDKSQAEHIRANRNGSADYQALTDLFCLWCGANRGTYKAGHVIERIDMEPVIVCYVCTGPSRIHDACPACKACHSCCRIANVLVNKGGTMACEAKDLTICYHQALLRLIPPSERLNLKLRYFKCRLACLPSQVQNMIYNQLEYSTAMALRQTCHRFFVSLVVSKDEPTKLYPDQWMCLCTILINEG